MAVTVPTIDEIKAEYASALSLAERSPHVHAEFLKAKGTAEFGDALFSPVYHFVAESTAGTVIRVVGSVFVEKHRDGQLPAIRRQLQEIRNLVESSANGRKVTVYLDWDKTEDLFDGTYWGFVIKSVCSNA